MATTPKLRELITFTDEPKEEAPCSLISVKGDATYCIEGPVCGGTAKEEQGTCPSRGDGAVGHCLISSRSFATGCIAPVDAHCVISAVGHWECVYPGSASDGSAKIEDAGNTTKKSAEAVTLSSSSLSSDKLALSASTQDTKTSSDSQLKTPNAALNVIVGASCCVFAVVGLVMAKKRRNGARSGSDLSTSDSAIMTL